MPCSMCELSAVYNKQSGKGQISDVSDVNKSKILIDYKK